MKNEAQICPICYIVVAAVACCVCEAQEVNVEMRGSPGQDDEVEVSVARVLQELRRCPM